MNLVDIIVSALISVIAGLAVMEFYAWTPSLVRRIIRAAVSRLPSRCRARYEEEWSSHIVETPGSIAQIWHAIGFFSGARRMFPRWRRSVDFRRARARSIFTARVVTRAFDITVSTSAIFALAPLLFLTAVVIKMIDRGPVFMMTVTIGKGGQKFWQYRFRSYQISANNFDPNSKRLTFIGSFLRSTSIDELPMLLNVVRGQMSVCGPRRIGICNSNVKPGITGQSLFPDEITNGLPLGIMDTVRITLSHLLKSVWWTFRFVLTEV